MLKHIVYLFIASIVVIFGEVFVEQAFFALLWVYGQVSSVFGVLFSANTAGQVIHQIINLFITPLVILALPAIAAWLLKRDFNRVLIILLWGTWLVTVALLI